MGSHLTHIVWDWNGTLLHDVDAMLAAVNASCAEAGLPPLTLDRYRDLFCVPVPRFYARLLGRVPTDIECRTMDASFYRHYEASTKNTVLAPGAKQLLVEWQEAGLTQSLCSLAPHESLVPLVRTHGIERHFVRVDGRKKQTSTGKAEQLAHHVAALNVDPRRMVVIGDALDDAVAASRAGARAVLYTGGSHSRANLMSAGVPVVDTLAEAVQAAKRLSA
ncbi:HAD family hydrolase [Streptomyces sp. NPDC005407]|uniref:HAD family hydrolase n=1 Tax=Streptomyces sp. NPDC005407 TaxID=3155340 RepID=UPI0033B43FFF